jgi:hypothetical protein
MFRKSVAAFFATAFVAVMSFAAPGSAQAAQEQPSLSFPISTAGATGTFTGVLRITSFAVQNNALVASGIVTGSVVDATGKVRAVAKTVTMPVATSGGTATTAATAAATASCGILHLELGPLDLDLLGLVVHLDRVVLDISAVPGAGNLLGNLLCSITNLLNSGGALTQIANLLNQLLGLLG